MFKTGKNHRTPHFKVYILNFEKSEKLKTGKFHKTPPFKELYMKFGKK